MARGLSCNIEWPDTIDAPVTQSVQALLWDWFLSPLIIMQILLHTVKKHLGMRM